MASAIEIITFANQLAIPIARAHLTTDMSVSSNTQLTTNAVDFDPFSGFNTSTGTFTCPAPGFYFGYGVAKWATDATSTWIHLSLWHNGVETAVGPDISTSSTLQVGCNVFDIFNCAAGDTLQLKGSVGSGSLSTDSTDTTGRNSYFAVGMIARI